MNGGRHDAETLLAAIRQDESALTAIDVVVFPSYVHLALAGKLLKDSIIAYGAQNLHTGKSGAFTGEISGPMLVDYGCQYVLVGHSERRALFHEDLPTVAAKFAAALEVSLTPILCVGELLSEREHGQAEAVLTRQIESVIAVAGVEAFRHAVVAYEPVWAIGTGLTATPEQAQQVHAFIRQLIAKKQPEVANSLRILYGGSVKADNAAGLFAMPDIDGALVGGASLEAKGFLAICEAATARLEQVRV